MRTFACQSGSNGNGIFVQAGDTRLLIDAGLSGKRAEHRMAERGQEIRNVDALLNDFTDDRLQWATLSHLSERNNTPKAALQTARSVIGPDRTLHVAGRTRVSDVFEL